MLRLGLESGVAVWKAQTNPLNYGGTPWALKFFLLKKGPIPASFLFIFRYFLITISIIQIEKSLDGVLGIRTRGRRMVGADKTTELWRPPWALKLVKKPFIL